MRTVSPPNPIITLYHLRCAACRAVLEVEKEELRAVLDRNDTAYVLTCPHCKQETWFADQVLAERRVHAEETP
jgi:uncharacterized protein with PIN domain